MSRQPDKPALNSTLHSLLRIPTPYFLLPTSYFLLLFFLTTLLVYRFTASLPRANQHNLPTDTSLDPGWAILADRPDAPAVIFGDFGERVALQYLKTVWGTAPYIYPTDAGDFALPSGVEQAGLVTYASRRAAAVALHLGQAHPQAAGEQLIALWPTPRPALPGESSPVNINFGPQLRLTGWELPDTAYPLPGAVVARLQRANWQIALYWQTSAKLDADYTVSVRPLVKGQLIMSNGEPLIQDHQPVWGVYPTSRWTPHEIVRDVYALSLPGGVSPEAVQIIVYKATNAGFENLAETTINLKIIGP